METEAERQIRFVIRILRYIGWPFAVLTVPAAALSLLFAPFVAFVKGGSIGMALVLLCCAPIAAFFLWMLRVAKRMTQREVKAKLTGH